MKINNLIKAAAGYGALFHHQGNNYLFYNNVVALLPDYVIIAAKSSEMPKWMTDLLDADRMSQVELIDAYLPNPDSKGKDIIRVFGDESFEVGITQTQFGYIERSDRTFYAQTTRPVSASEDKYETVHALLITDEYGDEAEIKAIMIGIKEDK